MTDEPSPEPQAPEHISVEGKTIDVDEVVELPPGGVRDRGAANLAVHFPIDHEGEYSFSGRFELLMFLASKTVKMENRVFVPCSEKPDAVLAFAVAPSLTTISSENENDKGFPHMRREALAWRLDVAKELELQSLDFASSRKLCWYAIGRMRMRHTKEADAALDVLRRRGVSPFSAFAETELRVREKTGAPPTR